MERRKPEGPDRRTLACIEGSGGEGRGERASEGLGLPLDPLGAGGGTHAKGRGSRFKNGLGSGVGSGLTENEGAFNPPI